MFSPPKKKANLWVCPLPPDGGVLCVHFCVCMPTDTGVYTHIPAFPLKSPCQGWKGNPWPLIPPFSRGHSRGTVFWLTRLQQCIRANLEAPCCSLGEFSRRGKTGVGNQGLPFRLSFPLLGVTGMEDSSTAEEVDLLQMWEEDVKEGSERSQPCTLTQP